MSNAPIALFAYARPEHLRRTVASLLLNDEAIETPLYVFCDAPRRESLRAQCAEVKEVVESITGFQSVTRVYRSENWGLAKSIVAGVGQVLNAHGQVIVVEDDLIVSPFFLRYMNDGLSMYAADKEVASIHGYTYPVSEPLPETFFIRGADCWGWATWERAWRVFEPNGKALLNRLTRLHLTRAFDLQGAYPYTQMLKDQIEGRNDSWAIRWHASCFLEEMLTLYPKHSLVDNIGNDSSGTHCISTDAFQQRVAMSPVNVERLELSESSSAARAFQAFLGRQTSLTARLKHLVRKYFLD
ncbi:MAG: hypothetical protein K2Q19_06180 [Rhodocyclaceae bacterium]|nr:hypothetical protein [Rhodocyclaceae bacterium]